MWEQRLIFLSEDPDRDRERLDPFELRGWTVTAVLAYRDGGREAFLMRWIERVPAPAAEGQRSE